MKKLPILQKFPLILQNTPEENAICCLAMIFKFYGLYNVRTMLNQIARRSTQSLNYYLISRISELFGFTTSLYRIGYEGLAALSVPFIVRLEGKENLAVMYEYSDQAVRLAHPHWGKKKLSKEEFEKMWEKEAICFDQNPDVETQKNVQERIETYKNSQKNLWKHYYQSVVFMFRGILLQLLAASFVIEICNVMIPFFVQIIIDKVLVHQNLKLLLMILGLLFCIFLLQTSLYYVRNRLLAVFRSHFEFEFFRRFFGHFIHLRQKYFDSQKREEIMSRFQQNLVIRNAFGSVYTHAVIELLLANLYLAFLAMYSVKLMLFSLSFIVMYALGTWYYTPKITRLSKSMYEEGRRSMGNFLDILMGIQNVKLLGIEHLLMWKWQSQYKRNMNRLIDYEAEKTRMFTTLKAVYFAGMACVYWLGAYLTFENEITIGEYIAFMAIFTMILNIMGRLPMLWSMVIDVKVAFNKINELLAEPKAEEDFLNQTGHFEQADIQIRKLCFGYQSPELSSQASYILKDFNLYLPYGKYVGIVGRNGSGKTTLVKILAKLYDDYEGEVLINGQSIRDINSHYYRQKVVLFPQQVHVFNDTIKNNILYGNPEASMEEIIEAAKLADLHEFVMQSPQGYHLQIGEGATKLSGGQQLKIGFARLFLSDPQIIILDEASSALDVATEQKIMRNLFAKFKGRTIISIAHRLNTLRNADLLVVIDKGQVMEIGSHADLIDQDGLYAHFIKTYIDF